METVIKHLTGITLRAVVVHPDLKPLTRSHAQLHLAAAVLDTLPKYHFIPYQP